MMDGRRIRDEVAAGEGMTGGNLNQRVIHCTVCVRVSVCVGGGGWGGVGFMAYSCVQI